MQARSAIFDLYGDHLRTRGGRAAVAALVRLLAPLGVAAPAVRTAISRMVRQGWLQPIRTEHGRGYEATPKAARRLDDAAARIYRTSLRTWDGHLDLVVLLGSPVPRAARGRVAAALGFLGYGALDATTWIAARPAADVDAILAEAGLRYERFRAGHVAGSAGHVAGSAGHVAGSAGHVAGSAGTAALVGRAWDLGELAAAYGRFVRQLEPVVHAIGPGSSDEQAYAARFRLVHAWRTFLFRDPQLPPELLPERWAGTDAAAFFDRHAGRLRPAADRHVDLCLDLPGPARRPTPSQVQA